MGVVLIVYDKAIISFYVSGDMRFILGKAEKQLGEDFGMILLTRVVGVEAGQFPVQTVLEIGFQ